MGRKYPLEKGLATHSGILAWKIPWIEEPGGLQSRGLKRVGHDRETNTVTPKMPEVWVGRTGGCAGTSYGCRKLDLEDPLASRGQEKGLG